VSGQARFGSDKKTSGTAGFCGNLSPNTNENLTTTTLARA
jgi:hypothetical protein